MTIEITIPSPGESITEVELANWFVETGDFVSKDQEIGEVESEKATLPLIAEQSGKVELLASPGDTVAVGAVVCKIDTSAKGEAKAVSDSQQPKAKEQTASQTDNQQRTTSNQHPAPNSATPLAKKMMEEHELSIDDVIAGLKKISSKEVQAVLGSLNPTVEAQLTQAPSERSEERKKLSQLRKKISERLVTVKNETAMLTTFNEVDMSNVMELRKKHQAQFVEKHGIKLGFMSLFAKAATIALQQFPNVNSMLDKDEIITPNYQDIGIAVQTDKGLMVPIIRDTASLSLADIEKQIADLAARARKNRIGMDELAGGTFTITNGGVFGSMLSTPILNPPQSGILGMHNIVERPVAIDGQVVIRPIMYLALSYDHRIIDGRDSVGFLKLVKSLIENPTTMLFNGQSEESLLLQL